MKQILNSYQVTLTIDQIYRRIRNFSTDNLCFISILKGGIFTSQRLLDYFPNPDILVGYLGLSSYNNGTETQEKIKVTYPLDLTRGDLKEKNIILIDDVFDSGLTMMFAKSIINEIGRYNSLRTAVLVRKMNPRIKLWKEPGDLPDIVGFEFQDSGFLVGSGMGKGEHYRNLNGLFVLEPEEIKNG